MKNSELDGYLKQLLSVENIPDDSLNGLQVEGREDIKKVAFAVSACDEAFLKAAEAGADALIVHHGLFWKNKGVEPIKGVLLNRIKTLITNGLSLFAYHLPLDAHPQLGNNAKAAQDLGLGNTEPFCEYHGVLIGYAGSFLEALPLQDAVSKLESYYNHPALVLPYGKKDITTVGIVSGGAPFEVRQASEKGIDLFVTGEAAEPVFYLAKELNINMVSLGHYATERIGVLALKEHIEQILGLDTLFIELGNPL
jgi:dinuclear metal center YbgI/SA1388 family protein